MHEHRVTPRELFFDLVFVFAFTQVATLLADDPTRGRGRGVLVLAALWWAWSAYAWLTNVLDPGGGRCRSRVARCPDRDVRRGACGAGRVRRRRSALRRRLPRRLLDACRGLLACRPRKHRPASRRPAARAVGVARRDPHPHRRLHQRRACLAVARRTRDRVRRRGWRADRQDGTFTRRTSPNATALS